MLVQGPVADTYRDFASYAEDESPCLADWARRVADDSPVTVWLETLPEIKRQPNLVFAAARWHGVPAPGPYDALRAALLDDDGTLRRTILTRATQTNEAGRMATLVPALAGLPGPLALVEVGASAGLCLYPDAFDYHWTGADPHELTGSGGPVLTCAADGPVPYPQHHPEVAWRAGVDLNPLDVEDDDAMAWLETLVWPEQEARRRTLRSAIAIARRDPPRLVRGDLLETLPGLVEEAARHGTPVVFHSAVLAYVEPTDRQRFVRQVGDLVAAGACHWLSNEGRGVLPQLRTIAPESGASFVLGLDGELIALTHGHGASLTWLGGSVAH